MINSIKTKLFLYLSIFVSMIMIMTMFYNLTASKKQLNNSLAFLNDNTANILVSNINKDIFLLDYSNIKNTIETFRNDYFENIYVVFKDGNIFAQLNKNYVTLEKYQRFNELIENQNQNIFLHIKKIYFIDNHLGYLIIENNDKLFNQEIITKRNYIIKVFIILLSISIIASFAFSTIITHPIKSIYGKLKKIDKHKPLCLDITSHDEFSYLACQIEDNHNTIIKLNKNLEDSIIEEQKNSSIINKQNEKLRHLAHHDALTNLPNRLYFNDIIKKVIGRSKRNHEIFGILFIDLNNFKQINDTYGHDVGDMVLVTFSTIIQKVIRVEDTLVRMGGDEFIIILEDIKLANNLEFIIDKINIALQEPVIILKNPLLITASIGTSIYPRDGDSIESILKHADKNMYCMKNNINNKTSTI